MWQVCSWVAAASGILWPSPRDARVHADAAAEQEALSVTDKLSSRLGKPAIMRYIVELHQPPAHLP